MAEQKFLPSYNACPAFKVRRRTASDATWRIRRSVLNTESSCYEDDLWRYGDEHHNAIYRTNCITHVTDRTPSAHHQRTVANDNIPSRDRIQTTMSAHNFSRPSETIVVEAMTFPVGDKMAVVEQTIDDVIHAHLVTSLHTMESVKRGMLMCAAINKQQRKSCEQNKMLPLSGSPDPKKIWTMFTNNMTATIKRVSAFACLLPGFCELPVEDQNMLFKQCSFEVILARYARCFTSEGMLTPDMTSIVPRQFIQDLPLGDLFLEQYDFADVFNLLDLSDSELGLVCAVLLVNSERKGLRQEMAVRKLQVRYLQALHVYLSRQHPANFNDLFNKILDVLPLSAAVNESHSSKVNAAKKKLVTFTTTNSSTSSTSDNDIAAFPEIHNHIFP